MSDVNFTIGGNPAPFKSAMNEAAKAAKEGAGKITEAIGVEGIKSERAIHTRLTGAFNSVTKSGQLSAESVGDAFEQMSEGLKLSMGAMLGLVVASAFVKMFYEGAQKAKEMGNAVKDALNVTADGTAKSIEAQQEQIKQLKKDAEATDVSSMSTLQGGVEAVVQAFEEGKTVAQVAKENAEQYAKIMGEAQSEEAQAMTKKLQDETALIALRRAGKDKEADELKEQQEGQEAINKLLDQRRDLQKSLDTGKDKDGKTLFSRDATTAELQAVQDQLDALNMPQIVKDKDADKIHDIIKQQNEAMKEGQLDGMTAEQKLAQAKLDTAAAQDKVNSASQFSLQWEQDSLDLIKAQNKQKELQAELDKENAAKKLRLDDISSSLAEEKQKQANISKFKDSPNQLAAAEATEKLIKDQQELAKGSKDAVVNAQRALEVEKDKTALMQKQADLQQQQKQAQLEANAARVEGMLWHGEASSSARVGLGGNVSHGNNASQLKAMQDSAKHLADIKAALSKLASGIGSAG